MVGERQFWLVWVVFLLTGNFVNFIALFWKLIGQTEARLSDRTVTSVGNLVAAISNTAGRLVWGALADLHGVQRVMVCEPFRILNKYLAFKQHNPQIQSEYFLGVFAVVSHSMPLPIFSFKLNCSRSSLHRRHLT
eukprot:GHVT01011140.1.p2 GENE.GHVT01011140.1~~GHVT01011140.1.p2  ORF type:complete len:135 (-),score=12.86 GHVT01011140.1:773-1177(-)